jgi:hypothetical protein
MSFLRVPFLLLINEGAVVAWLRQMRCRYGFPCQEAGGPPRGSCLELWWADLRLLDRFRAPSRIDGRVLEPAHHIASGERCESVAEKRSKQRTTAYTRLLSNAKDA